MQYQYLAKPSPVDVRDYPIHKMIPKLNVFPKSFRLEYKGTVKDQGQHGTCVSQSGAYVKEYLEYKQHNDQFIQFSTGFIYANRQPSDSQDEGMIPREMLTNLKNCGDVPYNYFPYNDEYPVVKAKLEADKDKLLLCAFPFRITGFCKLTDSDEIKSALMQIGYVTVCCEIYESFEVTGSNGIVAVPDKTKEKLLGYHEMTIVGWDEFDRWIVLNSWADTWADKGFCYMPFNFPIVEAWSVSDTILPDGNKTDTKFYRVASKKYCMKYFATLLCNKLITKGFNAIVDIIDGKYVVQLFAFTQEKDAQDKVAELKKNKIGKFFVSYF